MDIQSVCDLITNKFPGIIISNGYVPNTIRFDYGVLTIQLAADFLVDAHDPFSVFVFEMEKAEGALSGFTKAVHLWATRRYDGTVKVVPIIKMAVIDCFTDDLQTTAMLSRVATSIGVIRAAWIDTKNGDGVLVVDDDSQKLWQMRHLPVTANA